MNTSRIEISIDTQQLHLLRDGELLKSYPISSAAKGVGFQANSMRTPTGHFRITEKFGDTAAANTIFKGRRECGIWDGQACEHDLILSRILWLDGIDDDNRNTHQRYIYIHGTNHQPQLGSPCSCACIRMATHDIIELYQQTKIGTDVIIRPPTKKSGKLIFFDCDSTLSQIEGIDELARARGPEVFAQVVALTDAAMNGEIPLDQVFPRRMEIISPDRKLCERVAQQYLDTITPGCESLIAELIQRGWTPIILSGGFAPLIKPLARHLHIPHLEAVPLYFDESGNYAGYDTHYPTTRNGGKPEIIREWKQAMLPKQVVMVGDGVSDLETAPEVDLFVGYGGAVARESVRQEAESWIDDFTTFPAMIYPLIGESPDNNSKPTTPTHK